MCSGSTERISWCAVRRRLLFLSSVGMVVKGTTLCTCRCFSRTTNAVLTRGRSLYFNLKAVEPGDLDGLVKLICQCSLKHHSDTTKGWVQPCLMGLLILSNIYSNHLTMTEWRETDGESVRSESSYRSRSSWFEVLSLPQSAILTSPVKRPRLRMNRRAFVRLARRV